MKGQKPRILYFYYKRSSFVIRDIQSLSKQYEVLEFAFRLKKHYVFSDLWRQLVFIFQHWQTVKIFVCFFGGYHSFLPAVISRLSGKKCLIVAGGTDCVSFPSIGYGNFVKQPLKFFTCASFKLTSCIAPVHEKLAYYSYTYDDKLADKQGIKAYCKKVKTKILTIHNGYNTDFFFPQGQKEARSFLTVTYGIGTPYINSLKGIDLILQVAASFPDCTFNLVGQLSNIFPYPIPANVKLFPQSSQEELLEHYRLNEYYLQLSLSEGFPNSLCEAMLCECIPIGSDVGGISEIIGDTGFILMKRDTGQLKELIQLALKADRTSLPNLARRKIVENYSEARRTQALLKLMEGL